MTSQILQRPAVVICAALVLTAVMLSAAMMTEPPTGSVEGVVTAADTGKPIAYAWVNLQGGRGKGNWIYKYSKTDAEGRFRFDSIPVGEYSLDASAKAHSMRGQRVVVSEEKTQKLYLELEPTGPFLRVYISRQAFTSREKPFIVLDGFTGGEGVDIEFYRVKPELLFSSSDESLREIVSSGGAYVTKESIEASGAVDKVITKFVRVSKRDNEGTYHQTVKFEPMKPGIYVLVASAAGVESAGVLTVSDVALITKESEGKLVVFSADPATGVPAPGTEIAVFEARRKTAGGVTGSDGIWKTEFAMSSGAPPPRLIAARLGDSTAFINSVSYEHVRSPVTIYAFTDRPIYRPGQQVYFKGIVRVFSGDAYHAPKSGTCSVEVRDKRDTVLYRETLPLSKFGSFNGNLKLPIYAATGSYDVTCTALGRVKTFSFDVAEYRKPEFEVSIEMPKKRCVRGEVVRAKVRANYYFGAPVAGAEVRYSVSRSDYWFWPEDEQFGEDFYYDDEMGDYDYEYYGDYGYGENVASGTVKTGADGTAIIEFSTYWKTRKDDYYAQDQQFVVEAYVVDENRQEASAEAEIIATQGDFSLDVKPKDYIAEVGRDTSVVIRAADYNHKPQAGVEIEVLAGRLEWSESGESFEHLAKAEVKTDANGQAVFVFKPSKPGSYMVRASCRDRRGNRIRSAGWMWVPGETDFEGYHYPDLQLVLDKKTYAPGDTAKLLINTGAVGATAFLGVEGRKLFDYKLVKLDKKTTVIELPVRSAYKPNFYVTVCFVKNGKFVTQEARAKVSLDEQELKLSVTADKKKYEPGETAWYLVKAVNSKGKPVKAEVSLGLVDEAIYAIKEDDTPPILGYFYRMQPNLVATRFSFPDVYLSGDKGGFTGSVRMDFRDTAFWRADIVTDDKGEAKIAVKLPDNLTTWRATARACDAGTAFGETRTKVVVSKPLLVRLQTPRFLIEGDKAVISTAVHNYLPNSRSVRVTLDVSGVVIDGSRQQTVEVPSQGMKRIDWKIKAGSAGKAEFTAYAVGGEAKAQDAMKLVIPIRPDGQRMVESQFGTVKGGSRDISFVVRRDASPGASEIRVRLAPSPASALLGSLDYLAQYPYGCTEQTMSCFLPDVVIWRVLKSLGISNPSLEKRLPDMVGKGLNRLYDMQNENGGWGWCEYSSQDMWMTAYVVFGLVKAREAGFKVNDDVLKNGLKALDAMLSREENLKSQGVWYALYVLSLAGKKDVAERYLEKALSLHYYPDNSHQMSLAALMLANIGRMEAATEMMNKLWARAETTPADVCWRASSWEYQDAETTALALMAALRVSPDDSRIPKIVHWIISNRTYNYWYSTRDTAMVIYAVSEYLRRTGELNPDFTAMVSHNGRILGRWRFNKSSVFKPEIEVVVPSSSVDQGGNTLRIEAVGRGVLYYTASLTQYVKRGYGSKSPKVVTQSGIAIGRNYYKMVTSSGQTRLLDYASEEFRVGDLIEVVLVINSPNDYRRVIVEDYLPAGFEAFDRGRLESWEWSSLGYWWDDRDVRDERVTFYLDELPKGTSTLRYKVRAGMPGDYRAPAALAEGMYDPRVKASGSGMRVRIRD